MKLPLVGLMLAAVSLAGSLPAVAQNADKDAIAPDIVAEALWDGRKIVPFKAIDNPPMVKASEATEFLADDEYVLGVTVGKESRAYPTRFTWWHHFINDKIGDTAYVVSYCSVCNTGLRWDARVGDKTIKFDFYGLYNGVVTMMDRDTESVWLMSGRAVKGQMLNAKLKRGPMLDTTWGEWKKLHPDTLVMTPENEFKKSYPPKGRAEQRGYTKFPAPFFRPSITRGDKRLPPFDKVLGVTVAGPAEPGKEPETHFRRAYPIKALQDAGGVLNDELEGQPLAIFFSPATVAAVAVSRKLEGETRVLTFEAKKQEDGSLAWFDKETGSRWNLEGKAESGPLAGKSLTIIDNHLSQWYGWVAYFPDTTIYGRTDAPMPGNPFDDAVLPQNPK